MTDYIDSYYVRTLTNDRRWSALAGNLSVDICIVGGGTAGLTTALELQRCGHQVAILEANRVGWGASGRNGGIVSGGFALGVTDIVRKVGLDDAVSLYRLSLEGVSFIRNTIRALRSDGVEMYEGGLLNVARYDAGVGLRQKQEILAYKFGHEVRYWSTAEVREFLRSDRYRQALFDPLSFHFHPLNYSRALALEIEHRGGRLFESSPALRVDQNGGSQRVATPGGSVTAREVVFACGGYGGTPIGRLNNAFLPIATYVVLTEPAAEEIATAIRTTAAVVDSRRASDYYRTLPNGRLLWGGRITTRKSEPARLAEKLAGDFRSVYPQLASLKVEVAWSGLMAYAVHKMPQIGRLGDGIWYCTGFGGHGNNTTAICGHLIATAIAEGDDRYRLFAPFGLRWNGGPIGTAAAQLTYWKYRLADWFRERWA